MGDKRLETLESALNKLAQKRDERGRDTGDQSIENVSSDSSLKSLGAIVFNSGTLTTNVAIIKTNVGFVRSLAIGAVVINCLAIVASTIQVQYARPTKIRDLPSEEVGVFTKIITFFLSLFKIRDNRRRKRDNSKTTDDRIDELDADMVGLREDLESLKRLVSRGDQLKLDEVCKCLKKVSLNQLSNHPYSSLDENEEAAEAEGATSLMSSTPDNPPEADRTTKITVSKQDAEIRAVLLSPDFIRGVQLAKRVLTQLRREGNEGFPVPTSPAQSPSPSVAAQMQDPVTYDRPAGFILHMKAALGLLGEDPSIDEDFYVKRKRILLNVTYIDIMRKDLAARLTVLSANSFTYPLWIKQLNLVATLLGLAVLVLDIVVATYAGNNPSKEVRV